ncbi:putative Splicing factor 45 protein [Naja naja]|nr:putative Splicing factor 45 protein [Naja naja]
MRIVAEDGVGVAPPLHGAKPHPPPRPLGTVATAVKKREGASRPRAEKEEEEPDWFPSAVTRELGSADQEALFSALGGTRGPGLRPRRKGKTMSLYDDLGVETSDSKTEGWSKNFKLLQSQLQVKKAALTQAKSQRSKQSTVLAPVIDLKRGSASDERQIADTPPHVAAGLKDPVPSGFSAGMRRKDRHEASGFSRRPDPDSDEDEDYERERRKRTLSPYEEESRPRGSSSKAAIPPPMYDEPERPRSPTGPSNSFLANMGGTVAHKIMQKYGFREGQGLGKHEQGLSTALSVEKTSKRGGKIIVGDAADKGKWGEVREGYPR